MSVSSVDHPRSRQVILALLVGLCTFFVQAGGEKNAAVKPVDQADTDEPTAKPARITQSLDSTQAPLKYLKPARFRGGNGQQIEVELQVLLTEDIAHMRIQAAAEKPLVLIDPSEERVFTGISAGEQLTLRYAVQPQAEGLSYINVVISLQTVNGLRMSSYSIPVEVGDIAAAAALKPRPEIVLDEDGVALQIMRARQEEFAEPR